MKKFILILLTISTLIATTSYAVIKKMQVIWDDNTIATDYVLKQATNIDMIDSITLACENYTIIGTTGDNVTDMTMECNDIDMTKENVYYTLTAIDSDGTSRTSPVYILDMEGIDLGISSVADFRVL